MIHLIRPHKDPYFNIAAEEYVMRHYEEDVMMLWQSDASVIIGKHQNTLAEVNLDYVHEQSIPVIRRISGGGTVFHGPGNINYTLITHEKNRERLIDFKKFSSPIIKFLATHHIQADFEGKNNLVIGQKKFSGNAAHVYKNRVMHHGTLLFDCQLDTLERCIQPSVAEIRDKAVQSVRARVGNLKEYFKPQITFNEFQKQLTSFLLDYFNISDSRQLTAEEKQSIKNAVDEKYRSWDWNYGYSPTYTYRKSEDDMSVSMVVKNGIIQEVSLDVQGPLKATIEKLVIGVPHAKGPLNDSLSNSGLDDDTQRKVMRLLW